MATRALASDALQQRALILAASQPRPLHSNSGASGSADSSASRRVAAAAAAGLLAAGGIACNSHAEAESPPASKASPAPCERCKETVAATEAPDELEAAKAQDAATCEHVGEEHAGSPGGSVHENPEHEHEDSHRRHWYSPLGRCGACSWHCRCCSHCIRKLSHANVTPAAQSSHASRRSYTSCPFTHDMVQACP